MSEESITISIDRASKGRVCYACRICNGAIEDAEPAIQPNPVICEECASRIKRMIYPEEK